MNSMVSVKVLAATAALSVALSVSATVAVTHYFAPAPPPVETACDKSPTLNDVSRSVLRIVPDIKTVKTRPM